MTASLPLAPVRPRARTSLITALRLSATVLALLLLGLAVMFRVVDTTSEKAHRQAGATARATSGMITAAERVRIDAFLLLGAESAVPAERLRAGIRAGLGRLPAMAVELGVEPEQVAALAEAYQEVLAMQEGFRIEQARAVMCGAVQEAHERLVAAIERRGAVLMHQAEAAVERVSCTGYLLIYGTMAATALIFVVVAGVLRRLLKGVRSTVAALDAAARGDLEGRLEADGGVEFEQISAGIENLRSALLRTLAEVHRLAGHRGVGGNSLAALIANVGALRAELEQAFAELRGSEERFRSLVTNLPCAVVRHRVDDGAVVYVSKAITDITGLDLEGFTCDAARPLSACIHPGDRAAAAAALAAALASGQQFERVYRILHRDGSCRWVQERGRVAASADGGPALVDAVIFDITARRQLEERLAQSQKLEALGVLASGIAHDFNNILAAVLGSAELLALRCPFDDPMHTHILRIIAASERARGLVRQILLFTRSVPGERRPIELAPVVREALALIRSSLPATIEIRQRLAPGLTILGDPTRVHQLVMNLGANAGLAMPAGGVLEVELGAMAVDADFAGQHAGLAPGPAVRLTVRDSGVGMPAEVVARIFEPFFTTRPHGQGTGLGLAVVHGVVREYGGAISVYSEPGAGTTVTIVIPLARDEGAPPARPRSVVGGPERILFVDDEAALRTIACELLAGLGYRVTPAQDGQQALELLQAQARDFDLVITDVTMPRLTGPELLLAVRELRPELPVLFITGRGNETLPAEPAAVGTVAKPFTRAELAAAVRAALDGTPA
jgi:PAS domain S-box-containing protein